MIQYVKTGFILAIFCYTVDCMAQNTKSDSIRFDILLDEEMLNPLQNVSLIHSLEILPEGYILLASPNQFHLLGLGGIVPFSEKTILPIERFSQTPEGALMVICGQKLGYLDSWGIFQELFTLPDKGMGIKAGKEVLYVYDLNSQKDKYCIYVLFKGAQYLLLLEYPSCITDVLEIDNYLLFSSQNKLLLVDIDNKCLVKTISLPDEKEKIISITKDTDNNVIYFSSDRQIYRIRNENIECINDQFGGLLQLDEKGLLIFIPDKPLIVRIRNTILY